MLGVQSGNSCRLQNPLMQIAKFGHFPSIALVRSLGGSEDLFANSEMTHRRREVALRKPPSNLGGDQREVSQIAVT